MKGLRLSSLVSCSSLTSRCSTSVISAPDLSITIQTVSYVYSHPLQDVTCNVAVVCFYILLHTPAQVVGTSWDRLDLTRAVHSLLSSVIVARRRRVRLSWNTMPLSLAFYSDAPGKQV